ncbi:Zinc finger and BTB domain-containing protein 43 [Trichinella papuae]|uniref:Zinc finger and BTB domain-containing protein 43 n=1 Tax=Trichinella papuae TaxID=268474 RepID=A0A0V1MKT5_9BILA|nr:Zinc finger and BTB domain-containing protein 43 [Trichinella papuae]
MQHTTIKVSFTSQGSSVTRQQLHLATAPKFNAQYIILFHCITAARNGRSVEDSFSSKQGVIFRGDSRNKLVHQRIFLYFLQWKELLFANTMHMNIHLGIKPFVCEICGSKFSNRGARCNHMKKHSSVSPFVCPLCEKAFQWELSLKEHLKSHANRGHITDTTVGEIYLKQITQQKLKKKEDKKGKPKFIDPNTSQESPTVNCQRVSKPSVKCETFQEAAAYNPNTSLAEIPKTENQRPPLQQQGWMIKVETTAENGIVCVSKPLVKYETFQKATAYNPNPIFLAIPKTENQPPPLQQQGWMIKVETTAENGIVCANNTCNTVCIHKINCIRNDEGTSTNAGFGNVFFNSAMRDKSKDNPFPTAVNNMGRPSNSRYN